MNSVITQTRILTVDNSRLAQNCIPSRLPPTQIPWPRLVLMMLLAAFSWQRAIAEVAVPAGQRIVHQSWTFKDGAPEAVEALAQTADGYLWLGTPSGLYRFDGVHFELFRSPFGDQLPSTNVCALFAPPTGGLWVGYRFGGISFVKGGKVTNYIESPVPKSTVWGFAQDRRGVVWAATNDGVWRFDGSIWQQNPFGWNSHLKAVAQVGVDRDGLLWVLTDNRGVELKRQLFYLLPDGKQFQMAGGDLLVQGFTWDADHTVLTVRRRPPGQPESGIELESSIPAYPILKKNSAQIVDRAGGIWFLPVDPVVFHHPAGESIADLVTGASRSNSQAYDVNPYRYAFLVDREGSVWIGDQKGVHRFAYSHLMEQELPRADGPWFAIAPDEKGVVWVSAGNQNGSSNLYRVAGGEAELKKSQEGVCNFAYRALDKTLWFGGEGGLWHLADGTLTRVGLPSGLAENAQYLQTITQDRLGGVWVSFGGHGLYRLADGIWEPYGGRRDLPKSSVTSSFTDSLGREWFGSRNHTLALLDGDRVQTFGPSEGLRIGAITAIYGRGPEIWIGGEFGLQQFDVGRFHTIHAVDEQSLRGISGIVETANGDLWLNGLAGIFHIRRAEIAEALKNPSYQVSGERFDRREGLPGLPPQLRPIPTVIEGTDGRLWFSASNGVVWIDPTRASKILPPPPITIQSVSADDRDYLIGSPLKLPAHTSNLQIGYSAVSLSNPEAIRFRYKLQEVDADWHQASTSTSVSYRNLPPGSYHFVVNASDANGLWSSNTAIAEFTVLPAYYQTNWFRAFCVGMFVALLWAAYQLRIRQLRRKFDLTLDARVDERTRIARDLHDTLLQSAHGVLLRFQTVSQLLPDRPVEAKEKLDSAIEKTAHFITEARDEVQGLRDSTMEKNDLALAISTVGEELVVCSNEHPPTFHVAVEGETQNLHPILRDEVYKIATEALRNAFRHAQARQVEVEVHYEAEQFRLRVRDDGKGINTEILSGQPREGHYGLHGMQERAKLMGAKLTIWSRIDAGTEVELSIPAGLAYAKERHDSWLSKRFASKHE